MITLLGKRKLTALSFFGLWPVYFLSWFVYFASYYHLGDNSFKFFISGGISVVLRSELRFTATFAHFDRQTADLPPQMTNLNAVILILMYEKRRYVMTSDFRQYITEYTVANFLRYRIRRRVTYASALEWLIVFCD